MVETADETSAQKTVVLFRSEHGRDGARRGPHLHGASTSRRARLLLWLTGPFALAREAPERPLHEPSGPAQSTATPLHSEDTTSTTR